MSLTKLSQTKMSQTKICHWKSIKQIDNLSLTACTMYFPFLSSCCPCFFSFFIFLVSAFVCVFISPFRSHEYHSYNILCKLFKSVEHLPDIIWYYLILKWEARYILKNLLRSIFILSICIGHKRLLKLTGENAGISIQARKRRKWRKRRGKRRKRVQAEGKGRRKKGKCSEITHFNMSESPQATKSPRWPDKLDLNQVQDTWLIQCFYHIYSVV